MWGGTPQKSCHKRAQAEIQRAPRSVVSACSVSVPSPQCRCTPFSLAVSLPHSVPSGIVRARAATNSKPPSPVMRNILIVKFCLYNADSLGGQYSGPANFMKSVWLTTLTSLAGGSGSYWPFLHSRAASASSPFGLAPWRFVAYRRGPPADFGRTITNKSCPCTVLGSHLPAVRLVRCRSCARRIAVGGILLRSPAAEIDTESWI